jgi:stage II sporulation protein B
MKNNKARITYRFDHPQQKRTDAHYFEQEPNPVIPLTPEEFSVVEEDAGSLFTDSGQYEPTRVDKSPPPSSLFNQSQSQPLNQFTSDFGSWSSPFDEETERVERMIRATGRATIVEEETPPAAKPTPVYRADSNLVNGETGYYPEPDNRNIHSPIYEGPGGGRLTVGGSRFERYSRTPWLKIVASVTGAITTGVLIGFFVLSLFSVDEPKKAEENGPVTAANAEQNSLVTASPKSETANKPNPSINPSTAAVSAASIAVKIPARSYTLLQYGAFMSQQGADTAQAELRKLGLGAAVQSSDKFYVFAGLTPGPEEAAAIKAKLLAQKTEVYVKTVQSPSVTSIKWSGKAPETADTYFTQAAKLTTSLTNVTSLHLKEAAPGPIESNTLQAIHSVHQAWSASAAAMGEGLMEEQRAVLQKMNAALNTAVLAMDEYKKNPSASFLWQAQSGTMQYVLLETELLRSIAVTS